MATWSDLRTELVDMTDALADPVLTNEQIDRALLRGRVPDPAGYPPDVYRNWEPDTDYPAGASIVPVERDGYYYTTGAGGTSGPVEPDFAAGETVDNTVTWTRAGYAPWSGSYDLDRSAAYAWRLKQGIAAKRKNVSALGQQTNSSDVFLHCAEMAAYYAGRISGTITVRGAARRAIY